MPEDSSGLATSGYYRDEFGRMARYYDAGLRIGFRFVGGEHAFRKRIVEAADIRPGDSVLDVNCGTGTLALLLAQATGHDGRVVGTDLAERMLEVARGKDLSGTVDFIIANAEEPPFVDASFDRVTSSLAIHEMNREGRENALAEIKRVLKPDGLLVVADLRPPDTLMTRIGMSILKHGETDTLTDMWSRGLNVEIEAAGFEITARQWLPRASLRSSPRAGRIRKATTDSGCELITLSLERDLVNLVPGRAGEVGNQFGNTPW